MRYAWIHEPPFGHLVDGRLNGCDAELMRLICAELGESFEIVETDFSQLLAGLQDDRWDVTAGMFITRERAQIAAFTTPVWALADGLLIRHADAPSIGGYLSIAQGQLRLAVLQGQLQHQTALRLGISSDNILVLHRYEEAVEAVLTGTADAYASVARAHYQHLRSDGSELVCVDVPSAEKTAAPGAFACHDDGVRKRIDSFLNSFVGTDAYANLMTSAGLASTELTPRR